MTGFASILKSVPVRYTIVPSIFLSFISVISINPDAWIVSDVDHFYFEMFAVVLSTIVAIYCLTRAHILSEKFSFFVGIGFLTNAIIDFFHATLSFSAAGNSVFLGYFIPQTWFAGRTFLGAMLVIAAVKYVPSDLRNPSTQSFTDKILRENSKDIKYLVRGVDSQLHKPLLFSLIILVILAVSIIGISFFTILPGIVIEYPLYRPYEIPSLILFSLVLFLFYKKGLYKTRDVFYKGIMSALIIDIFGQIIMAYSGSNFHTAHNVAHIFKNSGYFIIVLSLAISSIRYNRALKQNEEIIRMQYVKLREIDKMKDEFIGIAAHELRTPVQPIIGLSELLKSKIEKDSEHQELLDVVIRNAKRLHVLTEKILDVTKITSQSLLLGKQLFSLNELIFNIVKDISLNSDLKPNVKVLYEPQDISLNADKMRVNQVIMNLLNNAIKFTNEGTIAITMDTIRDGSEKEYAVVRVIDSGSGIDPEILPVIFEKFTTKSEKGIGLGLFISKSIIEAHGGKIWAANNKDGRGATFTFSLPICKEISDAAKTVLSR
jgi:signal transduction histidine kinase